MHPSDGNTSTNADHSATANVNGRSIDPSTDGIRYAIDPSSDGNGSSFNPSSNANGSFDPRANGNGSAIDGNGSFFNPSSNGNGSSNGKPSSNGHGSSDPRSGNGSAFDPSSDADHCARGICSHTNGSWCFDDSKSSNDCWRASICVPKYKLRAGM